MSTRSFSVVFSFALAFSVAGVAGVAGCNSSAGDDAGDDGGGDDGGGDDGGGQPDAAGACADLAGVWTYSGPCGPDVCTITQAGCAITQVDCSSGAHSTSGSIDGTGFAYTGVTGAGIPATCNGTATGDTMAGACTAAGATCTFSGARP